MSILKDPPDGPVNPKMKTGISMNPTKTKTGTSTPMLSCGEWLNARYAAKQASVQRSHYNDKISDPALLVNPAESKINYSDESLVSPAHRSLCSVFQRMR